MAVLFAAVAAAQTPDENAAQRLLLESQRQLQEGNIDGALAELATLIDRIPNSKLAPRALLDSAQLLWQTGNAGRANDTAQQLIDRFSATKEAAGAYVLQGEIQTRTARSRNDLEEARTSLRRVSLLFGPEAYPRLDARTQARVKSSAISVLLGDLDTAANGYLEALEDEPVSSWTGEARFGFATVLLHKGDWAAALDVLQRVVDAGVVDDAPQASEVLAQDARSSLTLAHRLWIRPLSGQEPWLRARALEPPGLTLKKPVGIAASHRNEILVTEASQRLALMLSEEGQIQDRASVDDPLRPFFDATPLPYTVVSEGVLPLAQRGRHSFALNGEKPKPLKKILAVARTPFGDWVVADREVAGLAVFDARSRPLRTVAEQALPEAADLAQDTRGRIYALDRKEKRVVRFSLDLNPEETVSGDWRRPEAITIDSLGNLYVLDVGRNQVLVHNRDGQLRFSVGPSLPNGLELKSPQDLAVDGTGRLWIIDPKSSPTIIVLE